MPFAAQTIRLPHPPFLIALAALALAATLPTRPAVAEDKSPTSPSAARKRDRDPRNRAFAQWADSIATAEDSHIAGFYAGHFAGDRTPVRAARFKSEKMPDETQEVWLVERAPGERWRIQNDTGVWPTGIWANDEEGPRGPVTDPSAHFEPLPDALPLGVQGMTGMMDTLDVALLEGRWATLRSGLSQGGHGYSHADLTDWTTLRSHGETYTEGAGEEAESTETKVQASLLVALPASAAENTKLPAVQNFPVFGAKNWAGPVDASFQAGAVLESPEVVRLDVQVTDDKRVPVPPRATDKELVAADHLELWLSEPKPCRGEEHPGSHPRQLVAGVRADGSVDARWLYPAGTVPPVPRVTADGNRFSIWLPIPRPAQTAKACEDRIIPLTVAWSDADDPASGQKTLLATSTLKFARPETFGGLGIFGKGERYPGFAGATRLPVP